ncbi:YopX family protein [Aliarcobacter cryaerophilus]|uniref:YopX family protein n=1 Tax=Aliarcobacter cryaerophilus TaxID=28198 RepID=UPI0021B52D93|nr:YopX family protein [Aliarcobacter cryaerophilus]MCT7528797.1 YopX family protein [Aliarcobacter cryaerophilus]
MREIKFRVFIKWTKLILEVHSIDFVRERVYCKNEIEKPNPCDFYNFDEVELMQSTGLLDKNNDEIYRGNIIKDSSGRLMIVEWDNRIGTARYIFRVINTIGHIKAGRFVNTHEWITSDENDIEIIGNIFENPELLQGN